MEDQIFPNHRHWVAGIAKNPVAQRHDHVFPCVHVSALPRSKVIKGLTKSRDTSDIHKPKSGYDSTDETRAEREIRKQTTVGINGGGVDGCIYRRRVHRRRVIDCTIE